MPKLPSLTPEEIIKVLDSNGKGSYWIGLREIITFTTHSETKRRVVVPFRKRDLPKGTLLEILKQAGISKEELKELL